MHPVLADIVLVIHVAYVLFVASGFVLVPLGFRRWRWTRTLSYRLAHTAAIVYVAGEQLLGVTCPLTQWEYQLRGGVSTVHAWFPALLHTLLFYRWPPVVFTILYVGLSLLAVAYWLFLPPLFTRRRP